MRWTVKTLGMTLLLAALTASTAGAERLGGEIKLGGIIKDEADGSDLTAMPETFDIYDGFTLTRVNLHGRMGRKSYFTLDLHDINHESSSALFTYRVPSLVKLTLKYDRHRQLYSADGSVESFRKNMRGGFVLTPSKAFRITADFGDQRKTGERLSYPTGTESFLGDGYGYKLFTGRVEAEARAGARAAALGWQFSDFTDDHLAVADRKGNVYSLRLHGPCYLFPELLSHYARGSYGKQELTAAGTDYEMGTFQYLGTVTPTRGIQFQYRFYGSRVDDKATALKTDYFSNDFDVTWYNPVGNLNGGYGYVTNDNELALTKYDVWHVGAVVGQGKIVKAKIAYATSQKEDLDNRTLLQEMESSRFKASIQSSLADVTLGVGYQDRVREFPMIAVEATGQRWNAFGRWDLTGWGAVNVDYSYSDDKYIDRDGGFKADNHTITGRVDFDYIRNLRLSAGATYLDIGKNLDIEKSILSFEGHYDLLKDYFVEVKYNVYNYDDFVLMDRYYTANVVWMNVGYRLSID